MRHLFCRVVCTVVAGTILVGWGNGCAGNKNKPRATRPEPAWELERDAYALVLRHVLGQPMDGQTLFLDCGKGAGFEDCVIREVSDLSCAIFPAERLAFNDQGAPVDPATAGPARMVTVRIRDWEEPLGAAVVYATSRGADADRAASGRIMWRDGNWKLELSDFAMH